MKQSWMKWLTVTLALVLALSILPQALAEGTAAVRYGKVTSDQVFLRKQASTSADYWFRMDTNHVAKILEETTQGGKHWYKVETEHPTNNARTYTGYIVSDFFTPLTEEETQNWLTHGTLSPSSGTTNPGNTSSGQTSSSVRYGEVTSSGTNFRQTPSKTGEKLMSLERGTVVQLTSIPDTIDSDHWYGVRYAGLNGYIMSTYIRVLPEGSTSGVGNATIYGYVKLVKSSAHLRATPGGLISVADGWKTVGEVLPYVSTPVLAEGYTWYEILYGGMRYWVRGDCVQAVDSQGNPVTPSTTSQPSPPSTTSGYVITTQAGVNLRLQPFGEHITQIKKGVVLPYSSVIGPYTANNNSQYTWYFVEYNGLHGYIRSDCAQPTNVNGTVTNPPAATNPPSSGTTGYGYLKMIKSGVNLRVTPGGKSLEQLALGTVVTVTGPTSSASSYIWYPVVTATGKSGYVRSDCVTACDASGNPVSGNPGGNPGTTVTPTPTPGTGAYGYVQITKNATNIRSSMGGSVLFRVDKGGIYPMWGVQSSKNNVTWYPIIVDGKQAWVRGDCAILVNADGTQNTPGVDTPTTVPDVSTPSSYVITILDNVNLRASASKDSSALANVPLGTVMGYNTTTGSGGNLWYRVVYENREVWVLGSCVRIMTQAEYDAWLAQHPDDAPQTSVILGYVKTTVGEVNIRKTANGTASGQRIEKAGTVLEFTEKQTVRNIDWYYIKTSDGTRGWLNGNYVVETDKNGNPVATQPPATPTTPPSSGGYTPPTAGQEASYTTLKRGSTGTAVTNLVTELKLQGYYAGEITSTYTEEVENAVKAFQRAKGLKVDGIAGSDTQHALFQTVPVGQGSSVDFTFYPAEKIDWFTGGIQQQFAKGSNAKVYDVKTGIVWTAHRWSGFNHADVEPLTAADTARLCKIYGVQKAQDIWDQNHWRGRPILVLIGQHNYCASLMGMPHAPEDATIPNNNFPGVCCIHFTNSLTSGTGVLKEDHVEAIEYAYTHAPGGQKR